MFESLFFVSLVTMALGTEKDMDNLSVSIEIVTETGAVQEGRSVTLDVRVLSSDGEPRAACLVLPYVNQRRWGAHEFTDSSGRARIILPLPNPGLASVQVRALPDVFDTYWLWTPGTGVKTAYLAKDFQIDTPCAVAELRAAINGSCALYVNGTNIGEVKGTGEGQIFQEIANLLRVGKNTLAIEAQTAGGMPGVVAQLKMEFPSGDQYVETDPTWQCWEVAPQGWPGNLATDAMPVRSLARLRDDDWMARHLSQWPGSFDRNQLITGRLLPEGAHVSDKAEIEVVRGAFVSRRDPEHLVGMHWGSYFFPGMFWWQTAHAVPLVGFYESFNRDVIRQHALWLMDIGVDFIYADWPFYIPPDADGNQHWHSRTDDRNLQMHATAMTLEVYAEMRSEGYPVPGLVIMAYLANGPGNTTETVNEKLDWIYDYFVRNPRFEGLWIIDDGKPLVAILHNTMAPDDPDLLPGSKIDGKHFTLRYMGAQLQHTHMDKYGYWSWMDGLPEPIVTYRDGKAEAVTTSPSYLSIGGWLGPEAAGRRNGTTYLRQFMPALRERPAYVMLHQWNQFTGQYEGHSYEGGIYGDTYSVELSDDLEPSSLTADGYRGDKGGWGFYYLNISKALVDLCKQPGPEYTLMAVYPPDNKAIVTDKTLNVGWEVIGKVPASYTILLDGVERANEITETSYLLDLSDIQDGDHVLTVIAEGATTRYHLSRDAVDDRLDDPIPLSVNVPFALKVK